MKPTTTLSILALIAELRALGVQKSYQTIWRATVEGQIPAERVGKKWHFKSADVPAIAAFFTSKA